MKYIAVILMPQAQPVVQHLGNMGSGNEEGLTITFALGGKISEKESIKLISKDLLEYKINWLKFSKPKWIFNSKLFKDLFEQYKEENWLDGNIILELDYEHSTEDSFGRKQNKTICRFIITPEIITEQKPRKIFLSHKGIDKPIVRSFKAILETIGLDVWLDEDAMHAGAELERSLIQGFKDSCASVFFITPNYKDENYLATEINYAIAEKRKKGNRFSIIALVLKDKSGNTGEVPELLEQYVWKTPSNDLETLMEIIKALPLQIGEIGWK